MRPAIIGTTGSGVMLLIYVLDIAPENRNQIAINFTWIHYFI